MRRVVITGIGAVSPLGNDIESTWDKLTEKRSGIDRITRFDSAGLPSRIAGELKGFVPEDYLSPKEIMRLDPFVHYAVAAALMACEDAELIEEKLEVGSGRGSNSTGLNLLTGFPDHSP